MAIRRVGTVAELRRYPVKSMAAESLRATLASWHGFSGDRRWGFIRPGVERNGFPWLTIREKPDLWHYQPRFLDTAKVETSTTVVRTPKGDELEVVDPELMRRLGDGVRVIKQNTGIFDTSPISVLTLQSVNSLAGLVGQPLSALRFRPNIVINATDDGAFPEDKWTGAILQIGRFRCRLAKRDKRCVMVNVDPVNGESNPVVLRAIASERGADFGMYGTTVEPGEISVEDPVYLEA